MSDTEQKAAEKLYKENGMSLTRAAAAAGIRRIRLHKVVPVMKWIIVVLCLPMCAGGAAAPVAGTTTVPAVDGRAYEIAVPANGAGTISFSGACTDDGNPWSMSVQVRRGSTSPWVEIKRVNLPRGLVEFAPIVLNDESVTHVRFVLHGGGGTP